MWSLYVCICVGLPPPPPIRLDNVSACCLQHHERRAILVSIVFWSPPPFSVARSLSANATSPAHLPNTTGLAEKEGRLATRPLPLGRGAVPAVCYSVALEMLLKGTSASQLHLIQLVGRWECTAPACRNIKP